VFWFEDGRRHPPVTVFSGYTDPDAALAAARTEADCRNSMGLTPVKS
jgi:hypothetical protein